MNNLLVALDLQSPKHSQTIVDHASHLAKSFGAKVWLIHIAQPDPEFVSYDVGPQYIRDEIADELRGEHRQIQRIAEDLKEMGVDCDGLLIQGPTEDLILQEIDKLNIDLLIIGNKKKGFFQELFLGSVTDDLIKDVPVPIYLIPLGKDE